MNFLIVSESIDIEDSSASKVNVALIKNLNELGHNVKVFHYSRKFIEIEGVECVSIKEIKWSLTYILSRIQRVFQRWTGVNISKPLENFFGHSFTFFNDSKSISKAIEKNYYGEDLIITLSKGASYRPHHAMLLLPKLHLKWMAYIHDPYPFHCYPKPYDWRESGAEFKESFFKEVSCKAQISAFPSLLLKEWMGQFFPNFLKTGAIIPHQYLIPGRITKKLPEYFDKAKFNILHAGNLMKQRDISGLIEGYNLFLRKNPEAYDDTMLLFLGPASYHSKLLYEQINENVFWSEGYLKYDIVESFQKQVSINVILEAKSDISPFLPGKFPSCVKANKPILYLGPTNSETNRLIGEKYPFSFEIDDVKNIANSIHYIYSLWKEKKELKLNRKDLDDYLSIEFLAEIIEQTLYDCFE